MIDPDGPSSMKINNDGTLSRFDYSGCCGGPFFPNDGENFDTFYWGDDGVYYIYHSGFKEMFYHDKLLNYPTDDRELKEFRRRHRFDEATIVRISDDRVEFVRWDDLFECYSYLTYTFLSPERTAELLEVCKMTFKECFPEAPYEHIGGQDPTL